MKLALELVEYGVYQERVDLRAHVSVTAWRVYYYPLRTLLQTLDQGEFRTGIAQTDGQVTGKGYLVPPRLIEGCRVCEIPESYRGLFVFKSTMTTKVKGRLAALLVETLINDGVLLLPMTSEQIEDKRLQIEGVDIIARASVRLQVKCDWNCGSKAHGGTGNLFIQTAEINLYKQH